MYFKNPLSLIKLHSFKIFKTFKTHYCQQHWLNLFKIKAPLTKNGEKNPIVANDNYK
jgi:hypothetical protein